MKQNDRTLLIASLALFSMFFGAGNMLFPPTLGNWAGASYPLAILGFLLTSVGIVILGVSSTIKSGGSVEDNARPLGPVVSKLFGIVVILAVGPGLAIPRTAAATFEMVEIAFFPQASPFVGSLLFFALVLFFTFKQSRIIDSLGRFLTPALLLTLGAIIVSGFIRPVGEIVPTPVVNTLVTAFEEGYQTMDSLAAFAFTSIVILSFEEAGIESREAQARLAIKAGVLAGLALSVIYAGLVYIGATTSSLGVSEWSRTELLIYIAEALIGPLGLYLLVTAMALACLTTAIGLTASVGTFFEQLSGGRISYRLCVIVSTLFSLFFATNGVDGIVAISVPILAFIYPIAITMIFLNLLNLNRNRLVFIGGVIGTTLYSILALLGYLPSEGLYSFLWLPMALVAMGGTALGQKLMHGQK